MPPNPRHTNEYYAYIIKIKQRLQYGKNERFNQIVLGIKESLEHENIISAGLVLFEDYRFMRVCIRMLIKILI